MVKPRRLRKADNKIIETDKRRGESHFITPLEDGPLSALSVAANAEVSAFDNVPNALPGLDCLEASFLCRKFLLVFFMASETELPREKVANPRDTGNEKNNRTGEQDRIAET